MSSRAETLPNPLEIMVKNAHRQRYDFLIIGQGLAGSLLAWQLWQNGAKILVADKGAGNASKVAAGLISPVTGKRWVKTQGFEHLLGNARTSYAQLETDLGVKLWHDHALLRLYHDEAERDLADRRTQDAAYQEYLGQESAPGEAGFGLADDFGGRWILQAAHLATTPLLNRLRVWLEASDAYRQISLDHGGLVMDPSGIRWSDIQADRAIFCEGWRVIHNPWFAKLPWQPSQGEILTLSCQSILPSFPVNRGIWLLPEKHGICRIGATYRWQPLLEQPTTAGSDYLLTAFQQLFRQPPQARCIAKDAGIRPNTLDHLPILGPHPRFPQLILCNGFGSKGSLYAPWCSKLLSEHLTQGVPIPADLNIERYRAHLVD